jgi:hypothetical protein
MPYLLKIAAFVNDSTPALPRSPKSQRFSTLRDVITVWVFEYRDPKNQLLTLAEKKIIHANTLPHCHSTHYLTISRHKQPLQRAIGIKAQQTARMAI